MYIAEKYGAAVCKHVSKLMCSLSPIDWDVIFRDGGEVGDSPAGLRGRLQNQNFRH